MKFILCHTIQLVLNLLRLTVIPLQHRIHIQCFNAVLLIRFIQTKIVDGHLIFHALVVSSVPFWRLYLSLRHCGTERLRLYSLERFRTSLAYPAT